MKKLFLFSTLLWNIELNAQCTTTTFGPKNPAAAIDGNTGIVGNCNSPSIAWSGVTNVYTANSIYTNYSNSNFGSGSHYIKATNFGFSIPTNYRIIGIQVDVLWYQNGTVKDTRDCSIRLMKNWVLTGTDKNTWTTLPAGPTYKYYGSASDVWGSAWTATDINNVNFGIAVAVGRTNNPLNTNAHIDHIRITVTANPSPYLTNLVISNVTCNGGNDGSASVTASGGLSPYTFSWSTSPTQTSSIATGLSAGTYTVIVADANGCTNGGTTATISEPTAITTTVSNTNVSCNGGNNGSTTVTAGGGTPSYTYSWNSGQTTSSTSGLSFGNYTVTVTDSKGCIKTGTVSITQPTSITVTTSVTNANCGSPNGTASASVSGGTPSYTYSWSNGQTTTTATGLSAGSYTITVSDNKGCTKTSVANVSNAGSPTMTVTATTTVSFNGGNNGSASVTASGGVAPYTYLWCNGQTTTSATGLSANCNVTITDAVGCVSITPANIPQPSALTTSFTSTAVTCNGGNDGSTTVNVSGGTSPYSYSWNNGQTAATATNLSAGSYTVIVTDANSCTKTATVTLSQPNPLLVNISPASPSICNGSSVTLSAGFGYSSYSWSSGETTVFVSVSPTNTTTYSVTVSDVNGCTGAGSTMVTVNPVPSTPNVTASGSTTFCQGDSVVLYAPLGYSSYLWSPSGQSTTSISASASGNYSVTVSNAQGCTASSSQTAVMVNSLPSVSLSLNPDTVCINSGAYTLIGGSPSGGVYSGVGVSGGNFNPSVAGSGFHTITYAYTDGNGCTNTATKTITVNQLPTVTANATAATICAGTTITLTGSGTDTSYTWSGGVTNGIGFVPSSTTTYTVTGTDGNGCTNTVTKTITVNQLPTVTANTTAATVCAGTTITLTGSGTATSYTWSGGVTDGIGFVPSSTATYTVTGTNGNGCTNTATKTITVKPTPTVSISSIVNASCNGTNDGSATANTSGGTSPYSYSWSDGQTTSITTGLAAGNYTITITDANTCTKTATVTISQPNPLSVNITPSSPSICKGSSVTLSAGFGYSSYSWSNSQTTVSVVVSPTITAAYSVTVSDVNGCTGAGSTMVTVNPVPPTPNVTAGGSTTFCQGGSVVLYAPLGYSSYLWSPSGQSTTSISISAAGNYFVTVSNAQGCTASSSQTSVTVNPLPSVSLSLNPDTVCINSGAYALTGGSPNGGAYSGAGVSGGNFNPSVAGSGLHNIIYTYTDGNNCTNSHIAQILVDLCTGVNQSSNNSLQFAISPNPNNGTFTISTKEKEYSLIISNLLGEKIYLSLNPFPSGGQGWAIDLSNHLNGIYFLHIKTNQGTANKKLIIQK